MRPLWIGLTLVSITTLGCAGPNQMAAQASRVPYAKLTGPENDEFGAKLSRLPLVLEFKAGDEVPVELILDSRLIALKAEPILLIAKQDFYVLLRPEGPPLFSENGKDFTTKARNSFQFGFSAERGKRPKVTAKIRFRATP